MIAGEEELGPYPSMVAGLGIGDGVVFLWKDLVVVVVILQKAKERVKVFGGVFGVCGGLNGDGEGRRK